MLICGYPGSPCCPDWPQTPRSVTSLLQKIIKVLLGYDANIHNRMPIIILKFSRNSLYSKPASLIYFLHMADNSKKRSFMWRNKVS